jgi:RRXRR protein
LPVEALNTWETEMQPMVPVVSATGKPLMPTTHRKANKLIARGRALRRFDRGLFYIKLLDRMDGYTQPVAIGIDPGSKKEALVIQSRAHTLLNVQADAITWVSRAVERRRVARRTRRGRKCPRRQSRPNRLAGKKRLPPSTRARWGLKVRLVRWLARYYPLTAIAIEDIRAATKPGKGRWNKTFSPLEVGKEWCYTQMETIAPVYRVPGYTTKTLREQAGLRKSGAKVSDRWDAHCVDAFVLATSAVGGHRTADEHPDAACGAAPVSPATTPPFQEGQGRAAHALWWNIKSWSEARRVGASPTLWAGVCGRNHERTR